MTTIHHPPNASAESDWRKKFMNILLEGRRAKNATTPPEKSERQKFIDALMKNRLTDPKAIRAAVLRGC